MSLYNFVFGRGGPKQEQLWDILNLKDYDVGRYRDIYVKEGKIILLTRNGGGNREECEYSFESLKTHPNYLDDWDCDWDRTYAEISFSIPEGSGHDAEGSGHADCPSDRQVEKNDVIKE